MGAINTPSPFTTFYTSCLKGFPLATFWWYALSAMVFIETYIWAASEDERLDMVDRSRYERPRLNERPVFLRTLFLYTAFVQSVLHLYFDRDRAALPTTDTTPPGAPSVFKLRVKAPAMLQRSLTTTIMLIPSGVLIYFLLLRGIAANYVIIW